MESSWRQWPFKLGMASAGFRLCAPVVGVPFWFITNWGAETGHIIQLIGIPSDPSFPVNHSEIPRPTFGLPFPYGMPVEPDQLP